MNFSGTLQVVDEKTDDTVVTAWRQLIFIRQQVKFVFLKSKPIWVSSVWYE